MAAPMREVPVDGGPRAKVASTTTTTTTNFEYDDNEWDIGIGDLIIDLDADIEKNGQEKGGGGGAMASAAGGGVGGGGGVVGPKMSVEHSATVDKGLKMKIKRTKTGTKSSEAKHEIVKPGEVNGSEPGAVKGAAAGGGVVLNNSAKRGSSGGHRKRDKPAVGSEVNGLVVRVPPVQRVAAPPVVPNTPGPPQLPPSSTPPPPPVLPALSAAPPLVETTPALTPEEAAPSSPEPSPAPPCKKLKEAAGSPQSKETAEVCVGTCVGTITEPDCLGPCEPGTSVTLEGIVWHETEGVLVVNVTWRGKTYVGTLLDCTRHDWAPPRFCDSPTSDLDAGRTPKGRGKRGRAAASSTPGSDLSNFTETRSSVHSKLRSQANNGGPKGGRKGPGGASSPTPFVPPPARPEATPSKRKPRPPDAEETPTNKKCKQPATASATSNSPPMSPVLLECPEPNCSKKYKHINGLKYHQSHAHGSAEEEDTKESGSTSEAEEAPSPPQPKREEASLPEAVQTPPAVETPSPPPPDPMPPPLEEDKPLVKPGVLRFGGQEEPLLPVPVLVRACSPPLTQPPLAPVLPPTTQQQQQPLNSSPAQIVPRAPSPLAIAKVPQFKVKPASALMPEEKKAKPNSHKKKNRKSPAGSPHPHPLDPPALGLESGGREDVQSPAYSDISDDAAPLLEAEGEGSKGKPTGEKKVESGPGQSPHSMQHYGMYPYYGQPPYLVPSVAEKPKENVVEKILETKATGEKEKKDGSNQSSEFQQKLLQQHYYPFGYVPGYPYNIEAGYPVTMLNDEKSSKEGKSPGPIEVIKPVAPPQQQTVPLHIPNPNKVKIEPGVKEKQQNDNHQILKESIEIKNQMSPAYLYSRQQQQHQQQQDEFRRYYIYPEQRRKEGHEVSKVTPATQPKQSMPTPSPKHKEKDDKKEEKVKQEGVKPTMETQGPPPPPTSSYAYIHPGYMQSPHYGAIPFDPGHAVYRGMNPMLVSGPYSNNPYLHPQLHPQIPRYHAPEDLSRPPTGTPKGLELLHHANQYYSSHKIHELQERAMKSPTPKTATSSASPSNLTAPLSVIGAPPTTVPAPPPSAHPPAKQPPQDSKDSRSPPPQRHVHTHHHTHVGLGYPILAGQYPAPYGAAVLASQQAAAVAASVVSPFSPK